MDAGAALEVAFKDGLKVRGLAAQQAARVALALHASRGLVARAFLDRDSALARDAVAALGSARRPELALQVALWAAGDGESPAWLKGSALEGPVAGFAKAKAWAENGAQAPPQWISQVPREAPLREVFAGRLMGVAQGAGTSGAPFACAALEALLAEAPRPTSYGLILAAAALADSGKVVDRTLEGLAAFGSQRSTQSARDPLERLREALEVERERAQGATLAKILDSRANAGDPRGAVLLAHLAARAHAEGHTLESQRALTAARGSLERGGRVPRAPLAALLFIERGLGRQAGDPLSLEAEARPSAAELVEGACEAIRALQSAKTAVETMRLFDPEDATVAASEKEAAHFLKELVREGSQAAVRPAEAEALKVLAARVRRIGLRLPWEIFLRALIADGAAALAARHHNQAAWALALEASGPGISPFERAKMRGRAACEFLRALESKDVRRPLADLYFAPPLRDSVGAGQDG